MSGFRIYSESPRRGRLGRIGGGGPYQHSVRESDPKSVAGQVENSHGRVPGRVRPGYRHDETRMGINCQLRMTIRTSN